MISYCYASQSNSNSFCVQHKMVGDDYPSILQCLVYCHSTDWRIEIASPCVLQKGYSSSLGNTYPSLKLPAFYVCQTSSGQLLELPQISLESKRLLSFYVCRTSSGQLLGLPQLSFRINRASPSQVWKKLTGQITMLVNMHAWVTLIG